MVKNRLIPVKIGFLFLCLFFFISCNQKTFNTNKELLDYINLEENGYVQHKSVNSYDFTLLYRPTDLLVEQELGDKETNDEIEKLRKKYSKHLYFNLSISSNNQELLNTVANNREEFGAMVNQLAFGMREKVNLFTQSKDTIELADFIYPRLYGMSKSTNIMFVYPRDEKALQEDYLNFTIEDLGLYTGEVKFKIETKKIKQEPIITF